MSDNQITIESANVFEDLGFSGQEAENLRIRSDLMLQIMTHAGLKIRVEVLPSAA